jgi:glycosyltransferase involved in cell wall biosynthesis
MLDIVVVSDFAHVEGGNSAVALSSAVGLANVGHRVTLVSAGSQIEPSVRDSTVRVVSTGQYAIADDPWRMRALTQGIWNAKAARLMKKTLKAADPGRTVVHVHGWSKALSSSVIHVALSCGFKVICTLHDYFSVCPNGSFFNYPKGRICELRPLSGACIRSQCDRRHYGHKIWRLMRQSVQTYCGGMPGSVRHFIVVSELSEKVLTPFLSPEAHVYRVRNPVCTCYRKPVDVNCNSAYLMVGRIDQEKGSQLFAQAANNLGFKPVFVGDGEQHQDVLRICPSAKVTGWLPRESVLNELLKARVLVFPSLWHETDGLSVVEAGALGIPVIVSDTSAARESVIDGVTGLLFRAGDEQDLADKMVALQHNDRVQQMGRAAHAHYWKNPRTLERHVKELEHTYEQVLAC